MKRQRFHRVLRILPLVIVVLALFGLVVMSLWNSLMPPLFGFKPIGYWQAWGLIILGRLLFGGFRMGTRDYYWRHRMMERWNKMTPEEQEKFREGWCGRWGHVPPEDPKPSA